MGVEQDEGVVLFEGSLNQQSYCALRWIEVGIGIDAAGPPQMLNDQRRVTYTKAAILDEGQLALGRFAGIRRVDDFVGDAGNSQPGLKFAAERTQVRDGEHAGELEEFDRSRSTTGHVATPSANCANSPSSRPQSPLLSKISRIWSRRAP